MSGDTSKSDLRVRLVSREKAAKSEGGEKGEAIWKGRPRRYVWALMLFLSGGLVFLGWTISVQSKEISSLKKELLRERQGRAIARLSLNTERFRIANQNLEKEVRGDILAKQVASQAAKADQLKREAERLRDELAANDNCATPKSVRNAEGL